MNWSLFAGTFFKLSDESIAVSGGLSQGSCLSPLLFFIIYTNSFHEFEDQFADDFPIIADFETAVKKMKPKANIGI